MKKIKLIATISTLGVIAATTPVVATSCVTKAPGNYVVVKNTVFQLPNELTQADIDAMVPQQTKHVENQTITLPISGNAKKIDVLTSVDYAIKIGKNTFNAKDITELRIGNVVDPEDEEPRSSVSVALPVGFLGGCTNLRKLDLGELEVYSIGDFFLQPITSTDIKIMGGSDIIDDFISGKALKEESLDESYEMYMRNINGKRKDFNGRLTEIVLPQLVGKPESIEEDLTLIPKLFLAGQKKLETIDLSNFTQYDLINNIPAGFLFDCSGLKSVDFTGFKVKTIDRGFLSGCNSLETIKLPKLNEGGKIITSDDENKNPLFGFMNGCNKVHDIDFKPFMNLETIPIGFFGQLMPSNYLAFEKFADLKLEAQHFFNEYEMDAINLLPLTNVEEIKNDFLNACTNAKNIILPFSPDLEVIGNNFLANCKKLQTIDLTNLKELYTLGNHAFRNCESLTELDISDLKSISAIQPGFARNCVSLAKLNIGELTADIFVEDDTYDAMYSFALDSKVEDYTGIKIIVAKE